MDVCQYRGDTDGFWDGQGRRDGQGKIGTQYRGVPISVASFCAKDLKLSDTVRLCVVFALKFTLISVGCRTGFFSDLCFFRFVSTT